MATKFRASDGGALLRALGLLVVLIALLAGGAWFFRDDLLARLRPPAEAVAISPELADQAEAKLRRLREEGESARLSEPEISSLLRYRLGGWIPAGLSDPAVQLAGDTVVLRGRIPTDRLPDAPGLSDVRGLLPDTADVEIGGHLEELSPGRAAFRIEIVEVEGLPVPARFYAPLLERLGRRDEPRLAPHAVPFALPEGVGEARIEGGTLILSS